MFYVTGDTHGEFSRYTSYKDCGIGTGDTVIILGDAGLNYYGNKTDKKIKKFVNDHEFVTFCIHGNHEMRPTDLPSYTTKEYCGGAVYYEPEFPNILFAKDGEVYDFDGNSCLVIGGAYSVDKEYRLLRGYKWFANEQPSDEIKRYVEEKIAEYDNKFDILLTHTCPVQYEPIEVFLSGIDQRKVDKSTEEWLGKIEENLDYKKWYCGHYHTMKKIDKMQFMYMDIDVLKV